MIKSYKVKLKLNNKQKTKLHNNASVARFTYNLTLENQLKNIEENKKFLSHCGIRKEITLRKQSEEENNLSWLYDYDCDIVKQAVKDLCKGISRFYTVSKQIGYKYRKSALKRSRKTKEKLTIKDFMYFPQFKSKKFSKQSFFIDNFKVKFSNTYVQIPMVGKIRLHEKNYIPFNTEERKFKYYNPRCTFDGIDWFISVGVEEDYLHPKLTEEVVGIDLGLKTLAVCSNSMNFKNISKSKEYKRILKSKKQKQRQVSRKYEKNKQTIENSNKFKFIKTNNIIKLERRIQKQNIRLTNIKKDFFHKSTTTLVRTKPAVVVLEDLNVKGMMKNKHLSKAFQESSLFTFKQILINKCERDNITVIEADRFYPSSKLCSCCGNKKDDLKLRDRTYRCSNCGLEIDRDYNASLNLKQYPQFEGNSSLWRTKQNLSSNSNVIKESSMKKEIYVDFVSNDKILVS